MMNFNIPPLEALGDVLPGSPRPPEPAARYNAVNALLREAGAVLPRERMALPGGEIVAELCNVSEETLEQYRPAAVFSGYRQGFRADPRNTLIFGGPVADRDSLWGVALEDIPPGKAGPVLMAGIAVLAEIQGGTAGFVTVTGNGDFAFDSSGRAEVLYVDESRTPTAAVVLLGGGSGERCDGMFAVRENDDGTVTVTGGFVDLAPSGPNSPQEIAGATLQRPAAAGSTSQFFVLLTARIVSGSWQLSFEISDNGRLYTPGELISWPLARLSGPGRDFVQLWRNGMINFGDRYYLS